MKNSFLIVTSILCMTILNLNTLSAQNDSTADDWVNGNASTVKTTDNVVIGTQSNPLSRLEVDGNINAGTSKGREQEWSNIFPNGRGLLVGDAGGILDANNSMLNHFSHGGFNFDVNAIGTSKTALKIAQSGRVGINNTSPGSTLHVNGVTRLGSSNNYVSIGFGGTNSYINGIGTGDLHLRVDNSTKLAITPNGVGIGTLTVPSNYKLAVGGKVICEELRVKLIQNWPDYVADENYEVEGPIEQEKSFRETGALPGFPTEAELNGTIDLGEITRLQQEKIEELMLICSKQEQMLNTVTNELSSIKKNLNK